MKPLPHQQRIVDLNPTKILLDWETRCGKTLPACLWIDAPEQAGKTFIICKKANKQAWINMGTEATVLTKEEFKKHPMKNPTAIVFDEAHFAASPLFIKGRSQIATKFYELIREYPKCHIMLLTATPVRNDAWSLHTLLSYVGVYYDWKKWRDEFFELKRMPYLRFPAYFPKANWREGVDKYRKLHCDQVSLKDVVDVLPPVTSRTIKIKQKKYVSPKDEIVTWVDEHRHEQQGKAEEIMKLGYRKAILVCKYTSQIDELADKLKNEKPVFILDGRTKNQGETIKKAQDAEECYFIVQESCAEGWDGWMFSVMIFVSMSHSYVSNVQMHGRQRHPLYLRDIDILYMVGGRWDQKILNAFKEGENFNPHAPPPQTE